MYAYCEIIERVSTPRGRHGTGSTSVVRYWHVFDASWYWDQVADAMVYGQTRAYRYSDTDTNSISQQDITRASREAEYQEVLRTGLHRQARGLSCLENT